MDRTEKFIDVLVQTFPSATYVIEGQERRPYEADWRGLVDRPAVAVLLPASTAEVAAMVKLCREFGIAIVPQGGRTGLVAGAVPVGAVPQVIVSTQRMNKIRSIDPINNTMEIDGGVILQVAQEAAAAIDRLFPLSLASEGSCHIGGTIATNAGGIQVLSYGSMRQQVLGLEVVLPDGQIWNGLRGLRKDNTGLDLKQLFIGSEGMFGIITAATVRLLPRPKSALTMLAAIDSAGQALKAFTKIQNLCGADLTSCEYFTAGGLEMVLDHLPDSTAPFRERHPAYVLLEVTSLDSSTDFFGRLEPVLAELLETGTIADMVVAQSEVQRLALWKLREGISEAERAAGGAIKHDIAVPISGIPDVIDKISQWLHGILPSCKLNVFGHLGDGNLHVNIAPPAGTSLSSFYSQGKRVTAYVEQAAIEAGGTFSAEHGIGQLRVESLEKYRAPVELELMRTIKDAIDPTWMMNPGKVLSLAR
ncbi:FAD/FMN-containing dehydrogenase [Mycoplana sp. BE70]|uniref:FAD-binding oxidoreductase n=1 Tax=Mycoplana sp. BE70 TaxID=2817775 RepID=UPI00285873D4|nr:FAD-binding oxidoreductase [Mycoplana sp. BE70]MDR6759094.1 FAD/FMN-containing dehydrogenase [Mycoplana sp. BE70]